MLHRSLSLLLLALTVGCGGATARDGDGSGSGGGSSSSSGEANTNKSSSGDSTVSTSGSATSTTSTGPESCICLPLECNDGRAVAPPGGCCATTCTCEGVACTPPVCPSGETVTPPGHCCPQCVDLLCSGVLCEEPTDCGGERTYTRPDGACCAGCMPDEPASCPDIECAAGFTCPLGYVQGTFLGGCCSECLPDPLYCQTRGDCVRADHPIDGCCRCAEVISRRTLQDDPCWRLVETSHALPDECYPIDDCNLECDACPEWGLVECVNNRCVDLPVP